MQNINRPMVISQLQDMPIPVGLRTTILERIFAIRRRTALVRTLALTGVSFCSGIFLWGTLSYAIDEAYASGFVEYVRLFATDSDVAISLWKEFAIAMVNSAPVIPLALTCGALMLLTWSLYRLYQNMRLATERRPRFA